MHLAAGFIKTIKKSISETYEKRLDMLQSTINFWPNDNSHGLEESLLLKHYVFQK